MTQRGVCLSFWSVPQENLQFVTTLNAQKFAAPWSDTRKAKNEKFGFLACATTSGRAVGAGTERGGEEARRREDRWCAYSRVKGPTWRGPLSLGEEQELVVNVEDGEEE